MLDYAIYKTKGAAKFFLLRPHFYCKKCGEKNWTRASHMRNTSCSEKMAGRPGAVLVELATPKTDKLYDWENKIKIALSIDDIGRVLSAFKTKSKIEIFHDPNKGREGEGKISKKLIFSPGNKNGTFFLQGWVSSAGNKHEVKVSISENELVVLTLLFSNAVSTCLGWNK